MREVLWAVFFPFCDQADLFWTVGFFFFLCGHSNVFSRFFVNFELHVGATWVSPPGWNYTLFFKKKILWNWFANSGYSPLCEGPSALPDIRARWRAPMRWQEPLSPRSWDYTVVSVSLKNNLLLSCNESCKKHWVYLCGDVMYLFQWNGLTLAQTKLYLYVLPMHGLPVCAMSQLWALHGEVPS